VTEHVAVGPLILAVISPVTFKVAPPLTETIPVPVILSAATVVLVAAVTVNDGITAVSPLPGYALHVPVQAQVIAVQLPDPVAV
jgi:hypothetical protein